MPIADLLHNARYLTNSLGEQTDVVISIDTWNTLMSVIQPLEDAHWAKLAEVAIETSNMVGSDRFTQEIEQFITPIDGLRTQDSRTALLQQAGMFADDPMFTEIRHTIYENRGRSETETELTK